MTLEEEQEILDLVKNMWDAVLKMKQFAMLREEVVRIEGVLKVMVLKLAKPKLQILEEGSNFSLKMPPFKYSSPNNILSLNDFSKQSI
jgi:hypothetical protein